MLEKNIDLFANELEDMELKETAKIFRDEFSKKPNDEYQLGKYNILKHLQIQFNKFSGNNTKNKFHPTSKKRHREHNEIFDNFIKKLQTKNSLKLPSEKITVNESIVKRLNDKIEKEYNATQNKPKKEIMFSNNTEVNYYETNENEENDLPCFGSSAKRTEENAEDIKDSEPNIGKDINTEDAVEEKEGSVVIKQNSKPQTEILSRSFGEFGAKINSLGDDDFDTENADQSKENSKSFNSTEKADESIDEYVDDEDPGFDLYECDKEYFADTCNKLSAQYDFPHRAVVKSKFSNYTPATLVYPKDIPPHTNDIIKEITGSDFTITTPPQNKIWSVSKLSSKLNFPNSNSDYYPVVYRDNFIDSYDLKFVVDRERTGFEESKDFKIVINSVIAGRYQILAYLGNAAFSKAVKCLDIRTNELVCLKIIENNKDYFDQSLDEIKVLRFINANCDVESNHILKLYGYFYFKEHLFIVTELLKDNLFDFYDYCTKHNLENYFTLPIIQKIAKQVLTGLSFLHSIHLIHCDLKPENILLKNINNAEVKIIDFGSSSFVHDSLSSYIQSRSYRAPEVIMGCKYDCKIDIWSLGCILAELYSGNVLFQSDSVQSLLARVIGIIGPIPEWMFLKGKTVKELFTKEKLLYMEAPGEGREKGKKMHIIIPKRSSLKKRVRSDDEQFLDFVKYLLTIDPNLRPTAEEALKHKWISEVKYSENK